MIEGGVGGYQLYSFVFIEEESRGVGFLAFAAKQVSGSCVLLLLLR